jgi:NADPH-dependent 2,4-dienoyl-CoA reductase/sulfur reductase-like enzyme
MFPVTGYWELVADGLGRLAHRKGIPMARHALISGASIAGPALAHQLAARGWRTTVLERAPQRREEGHNIDVRGAAREAARRMGIEDDIRAGNWPASCTNTPATQPNTASTRRSLR